MKNYQIYFKCLLVCVLLAFTGCDDDDNENYVPDPDEFGISLLETSQFGNILVSQNFQSIYFFTSDVNGGSNCVGGCLSAWPPVVIGESELTVGTGLLASDFSTITRSNGQIQLTYKGWPLYYFSPDADGDLEENGAIQGDGIGGAFFVAKPDYTVMLARQIFGQDESPTTYLVDDRGLSLYDFTGDEENVSNCSGGCAEVWPPIQTPASFIVPSALNTSDFSYLERNDNLGNQLSFKGNPLYYFAPDESVRGNVLGEGGADGKFFVAGKEL